MTKNYPIVFTLPHVILGTGYVARVLMRGRAVLRVEDDGFNVIYGVMPSAIASGGKSFDEARLKFCEGLHAFFLDVVAEAEDFPAFKRQVESFFNQPCDKTTLAEWNESLAAVRRGELRMDGLESVLAESHPGSLTIVRVGVNGAADSEDKSEAMPPAKSDGLFEVQEAA